MESSSHVQFSCRCASGQPIRDAASHLPSDPIEMLYLLGQKSSHNLESISCQSVILLILYTSCLYDDRLADDKLVLASLEQYILLNNSELLYGAAKSETVEILLSLKFLLELLTTISEEERIDPGKFNCNSYYLKALIAVLEGMLHFSDIRVAMNCSLCLSIVLGWQKQDISAQVFGRNNWCRLVIEELVMSLAVPSLTSKSLPIHHKPAVHVAVALLKLHNVPQWMSSVFEDSSILGIVNNLSASNLSPAKRNTRRSWISPQMD